MPEIDMTNEGDVFALAAQLAQHTPRLGRQLHHAACAAYQRQGEYERAADFEAAAGNEKRAHRLYRQAITHYVRTNPDRAAYLAALHGDERAAALLEKLQRRYERDGCTGSVAYIAAERALLGH